MELQKTLKYLLMYLLNRKETELNKLKITKFFAMIGILMFIVCLLYVNNERKVKLESITAELVSNDLLVDSYKSMLNAEEITTDKKVYDKFLEEYLAVASLKQFEQLLSDNKDLFSKRQLDYLLSSVQGDFTETPAFEGVSNSRFVKVVYSIVGVNTDIPNKNIKNIYTGAFSVIDGKENLKLGVTFYLDTNDKIIAMDNIVRLE